MPAAPEIDPGIVAQPGSPPPRGIKCSKSPLDRAPFVQVTVCVDLVDLNVITLKEVEGINQWLIAILNQNRDELS